MKSGAEIKVGAVVLAAVVVLGLILYYFIGVFAARMGYPGACRAILVTRNARLPARSTS